MVHYLKGHCDGDVTILRDHIDGNYLIVIWDSEKNVIHILSDRYGHFPLYYYHENNLFVFSTSMEALLAAVSIKPSLNYSAIAQILCFKRILSVDTLIEDVCQLESSSHLTYRPHTTKITIEAYWRPWSGWTGRRALSQNILPELVSSFTRNVNRLLEINGHHILALSGGYDSRAIAACILGKKEKFLSVSYGNRTSPDVRIAKRVALACELPFEYIEPDDVVQVLSKDILVKKILSRSGGMLGSNDSFSVFLKGAETARRFGKAIRIIGHGGELASLDDLYFLRINKSQVDCRMHFSEFLLTRLSDSIVEKIGRENVFTSEMLPWIDNSSEAVRNICKRLPSDLPVDIKLTAFFLNEFSRNRQLTGMLNADGLPTYTPYFDLSFIESLVRTPVNIKMGRKIHHAILAKNCPALLKIIHADRGYAPCSGFAHRKLQGILTKVTNMLLQRARSNNVSERRAHLRRNNLFREILFSERALSRNWYRRKWIEYLFNRIETSHDCAGEMWLICIMGMLELWFRETIERDKNIYMALLST
jgi:hypothetical protein